ncbi:hypothetical protein ACSBR2_005605 [Camellia fascicularis]
MDEEELQKRNTDCVYFLASPLTCKKGIECEYRHSEIARLNPRDCWYWLAGSCFNPSCAFRHPPLDTHTEVSSESAPPQSQCSAPTNKVNAPCYFYFNGFCNKGDRCSFLHGPNEDGTPAWKSSEVTGALPLENKASARSDAGSAPIETFLIPSEAAPKREAEIQSTLKEDVQSALNNVKDQSASPHLSTSDCEETSVRSDTLLLEKGLIQSRSLVCTDQSSEEQVDGPIVREDWLESSPGFDVLVGDISEGLGYEDDQEYLLSVDRDGMELNGNFLGYDYEDRVEYDPTYHDAGILYDQERRDSHDQFDNYEQRFDYIRKVHGYSREKKMLDPRKRKLTVDLVIDGRRGVDLRDHLKKHRVIDGLSVTRFSRRNTNTSSFLADRSRERSRQHGRFRDSFSNRPRQHYKEKRQSKPHFLSSEISRKPVSRKRKLTEESTMFTGPKTLAQIKEEKRKAPENGYSSGGLIEHSSQTTSEEFQGPKPLSEILKDKKKPGPVLDANNDSS